MEDNTLRNFIPISRKIFEHHLWCEDREYSRFEAWIYLLQEARFEDTKLYDNNKVIELKRGQVYHSLSYLAEAFGWTVKRVRTFLQLLESDGMIAKGMQKGTTRSTITICNYEFYNSKNKSKGTQKARGGHAVGNNNNTVNTDNNNSPISSFFETSENQSYNLFKKWVSEQCPFVTSMKSQMTEKEFETLKSSYSSADIQDVIESMDNTVGIAKKYTHVYRTANNWLKMRNNGSKTT